MEIQQKVDETVAPDHQISAPSDSCVSERDDGLEAAVVSQHDGIPSTDTSVSPHGQDKCSSTKEQRKRKQVNVESKCLEHTEFAKDSAATEMHTSSNPTDCVDSDLNEDIVILNELSTADHASTGQCVSFESPKRAKTAKMTDSKLDIEPDETTQSLQLPTNKESKCLDDTIGTKDSAATEMNTSSRPTDCVDSDINEDLVLLTGLSTVDDASTVECVSFDSPQKSKSAQMSDPKCDIQPNETTQPHQLPTKEVNNLTDVEVRHRHNKPKKAYVSMINEQDYICDEEDMNVIDSIRDSRDGRTVVKVDGHVIAFSSFKCLLNPTAFLDGELQSNYRVWYGNRPKRDQCLLMNVFPDNLETSAAVIACDLVLVPFHFRGEYSIYCFDTKKRTITIVEATHKPLQTGVTPGYCRHYNDKIQKICRVFDHAMEIVSPEYNDDSYDWWRTIVHDPWLLGSREQTGFSVTMWFWDAKYKLKNAKENKDPMIVRKYFFTHVLTSKWNECTESIPDDILRALRIENQRLAKCLFG